MKRISLFILGLSLSSMLLAGGIITNTNQSAMFTRLQARDATLGIDAVYYNPAGLTLLPNDGFFLSINNQTISQTRKINSNYGPLNNDEYIGKVSAPLFPGVYAAYKTGNLAFSFGFNPIGGGGGGTYDTGLPSFEYSVSDLAPALALKGQDVRGYQLDAYFEGSSVFFGYQGNISYQINDMISVAVGGRFVTAKEAYNGYLRSVNLNMAGTLTPAHMVMTGIADQFRPGLAGTSDIVTAGYGGLTFAEAEGGGVIDAPTRAALEGGITAMGLDPSTMTIADANAAFAGTVANYDGTAAILQDQAADYEKTATGFAPIISVNIKASDKINLAFKYEHLTKLEFTNKTSKDFTTGFNPTTGAPETMFPDGAKTNLDIPSQFVVGGTFKPIDDLMISTGFHYYLDKNANWDGREEKLDANSWEFAIGAEYNLSEKFLVSAGWLRTSGSPEDYQNDLSFDLGSNSVGGGFVYRVSPMLELNLAGSYTKYIDDTRTFSHDFAKSGLLTNITESYAKDAWVVAIGLNFNFSAGK
jgi:long-chain fatty acid transport protein